MTTTITPLRFSSGTTQIRHYNKESLTGAPLVLPLHLLCNTDDDLRAENIAINSRKPIAWMDQRAAHDRTAVICGSGPSIRDREHEIRDAMANGATVFALNGAAKWLNSIGITPDVQVMIDARPENADLLGTARHYMLASQCHPDVVDQVGDDVTLVHVLWERLDESLPRYGKDYTVIGSAATVGTMATFIAYAMGYRDLRLYGYDSSHKTEGDSHALPQPMNDGEPCGWVQWNGKNYLCSLVMKQQAEEWKVVHASLADLGCVVRVIGDGLLPDMVNTPVEQLPEKDKYERMWAVPAYRAFSPAQEIVDQIAEFVPPGVRVMDFGCGTGRAAVELAKRGYQPVLVDFAGNCRDSEAMDLPFIEQDLTEPICTWAAWGYCCDVMEHIPPDDVGKVLWNISTAVENCFFRIETRPDSFGPAVLGMALHLSVYPDAWWLEKLRRYWPDVEAKGDGIFLCRRSD